ncbi:hypothetical protein U9M48_016758 [Paspalum notatum var. saurae]|uniref:CCHC-type domain-containing protein n=1 Tax=Paspalum notatum var. saurae TaxID=547442 RepID=A0AAQ3T7T3_PASNO
MELQHQYTISYAKAYRTKQKVFEMRFGTYEDSYDNLPRMLATIAQRNPGTYYDVMHFPNPEGARNGTFQTQRLKRLKGRRRTRRIRNGMDEAEAGKRPKQCTQCGAVGHNYKKCPENAFPTAAEAGPSGNATDGMAEEPPTPEPLDPVVDSGHRSYTSAVEHKHLATFQCCGVHDFLLSVVLLRVVLSVGTVAARPQPMIDNSLITALVDRWRPETHTFHMPCGEMAPTLQDVSYLFGLPIAGTAVGPRVVPASWKDDLEIRFAGGNRSIRTRTMRAYAVPRRPTCCGRLDLLCSRMALATPSTRYSYPMRERLRMHPRMLFPFGVGVRACRRRRTVAFVMPAVRMRATQGFGLRATTTLWSYERLAVSRPIVDHRGYEAQYYGQHDDDGPTMVTLWVCPRERTWANEQARRTYPSFVVALDRLVAEDVIWEPYSAAAVGSRAPYGLSSMYTSNETLWYTTASLVYDIYIEPHYPHRAMRQFGYAQQFPVPRVIDRVTPQDHRLSRLGQPCSGTWVTKVEPYVQAWDNAHQDVVHPVAPHTDWWYETFLTWYRPRTRCHVTYADTQPVPHESSSTDAYARHRDEALAGAMQICCQLQSNTNDALQRVRGGNPFTPDEQLQRLTAANESLVSMMHAWGYSIPLQGPPAPAHRFFHAPSCSYMPPMDPASTSYTPMHPSPQHVTPMDPPSMSYTPMGTSLQPQSSMPYQPMGLATSMSFTPIRPQTTGFNLFEGVEDHQLNFSDLEHDQHDIIGASQLGGAPLFPTQEATQTPVEQIRPHRVHWSPDLLTYSVGHVHAQQRAKRGRSRRDG